MCDVLISHLYPPIDGPLPASGAENSPSLPLSAWQSLPFADHFLLIITSKQEEIPLYWISTIFLP